ncbi:MAG: PAS domain S-box protein [Planctomycetes bacterium]|nr:PAS domain S-box protein [Planctomycetota bacterium]
MRARLLIGMIVSAVAAGPFSPPITCFGQSTQPHGTQWILILHSYEAGRRFSELQERGVRDALFERSDRSIRFETEYLDVEKNNSAEYLHTFAELLRGKYSRNPPSVIVAIDTPAVTFVIEQCDSVFPGIPVVYSGLMPGFDRTRLAGRNITGVPERITIRPTVELALHQYSQVRHVLIISPSGPMGNELTEIGTRECVDLAKTITIQWMHPETASELRSCFADAPPDAAIVFLGFFDWSGVLWGNNQILGEIVAMAKCPVYTVYDAFIGQGVIGGYVTSGRREGRAAGALVARVLKGESARDIPAAEGESLAYVFDHRELKRRGISIESLPPNSDLLFVTAPYWQEHAGRITGALVISLAEAGIIAVLIIQRRRRVAAEKIAAIHEKRYRLLFEENVAGAFLSSADGTVRESNRAFAQIFGFKTVEEANNAPVSAFYADLRDRDAYLDRLRNEGMLRDYEHHFRRPDGTDGYALENVRMLPHEWGVKDVFFGTIVDITEQKKATDALRESEARLRAIFDNAGVGIAEIDVTSRIVGANHAFAKMLGYEPSELIGKRVPDISHPSEMVKNAELVARAIHGEIDRYSLRKRYFTKDGREVWGDLTAVLRRDDAGKPLSIVSVIRDVTERVRDEAFTAGVQRILEHIATGHELGVVMDEAVAVLEQRLSDSICSVLLCDEAAGTVSVGAMRCPAPDFEAAINKLSVVKGAPVAVVAEPNAGVAINEDEGRDPIAATLRPLAHEHGFRTCWSRPIFGSGSHMLGTIASCYRDPKRPSSDELASIEKIARVVGIAIERDRAREALRSSEARFRMILDNEPECVKVVSRDGRLMEMNPAGLHMIEADSLDQVQGRLVRDLVHADDFRIYAELHDRVCRGATGAAEFRIRGLKGTERFMETSAVPWRNDRGAIIGVLSVTRDITLRKQAEDNLRASRDEMEARVVERTAELASANQSLRDENAERRRAEEKLRESEERFRLLFNSTFEGILLHHDGIILEANESVIRMFRYDRSELLHMTRDRLIAGSRHPNSIGTLRGLGADDSVTSITTTGIRKDGSRFPIEMQTKEIPFESSVVCVTAIRDLTEQQKARELIEVHREELAHVQRLSTMGEMATGLAHELNQPLAAIKNYTQGSVRRLMAAQPEIAPVVQAMEAVADQAQRASEIVRRIREMVRKREPQASIYDLVQLCRNAVVMLESELNRSGVTILYDLPREPVCVKVDRVQMEQVLVNILKNASEAMGDQPGDQRWIRLSIDPTKSDVITLVIDDNGPGIPEPLRSRVFDAFFSTKDQGMGMGLSISRSIVEAHGGRLVAQATENGGASFTIVLPRDQEIA